jgi:hypothetical protein
MQFEIPLSAVMSLVTLQFAVFGWRVQREIALLEQRRKVWLLIEDYGNLATLFLVLTFCIIYPLSLRESGGSLPRISRGVFVAGGVVLLTYPICLAAHYGLLIGQTGRPKQRLPDGSEDWAYLGVLEGILVFASWTAAFLAGVVVCGEGCTVSWFWNNAEKIGNLAQVFIAVLASVALIFTYLQIAAARRGQHEATAKEIYRGYLEVAFENPELAIPSPETDISSDKYRWFVSILLNACDELLYGTTDPVWRTVVSTEVKYHERYLGSREFLKEDKGWSLYSDELQAVAKQALK